MDAEKTPKITSRAQPQPDRSGFARRYSLFAVAAGIRLLYLWMNSAGANPFLLSPVSDEAVYADTAMATLGLNKIGETAAASNTAILYLDIMYLWFVTAVFGIFGPDLMVVRFIQIFLDATNAILLRRAATSIFGPRTGEIAGWLYAFYPPAWFFSIVILKTVPTVTAMLGLLDLLLSSTAEVHEEHRWRSQIYMTAGVTAGILSLLLASNVLFILLVPAGLLYVAIVDHGDWAEFKRALYSATAFCMAATLVLMLNGAKNFAVYGSFTPIKLLYKGPQTAKQAIEITAITGKGVPSGAEEVHAEAENRLGRKVSHDEAAAYWRLETFRKLASDPAGSIRASFEKFGRTFQNTELADSISFNFFGNFNFLQKLPLPGFGFHLGLAMAGLLFAFGAHENRLKIWPIIFCLPPLAAILLYYSDARLRFPMVPMMMIFSAYAIEGLGSGKWFRGRILLSPASIAIGAVVMGVSYGGALKDDPARGQFLAAKAFLRAGQIVSAEHAAKAALEIHPDSAEYADTLGTIFLAEDEHLLAKHMFLRSIEIDPDYADAWHHIALIRYTEGDITGAVKAIDRAVSIRAEPQYESTRELIISLGDKREIARKSPWR